MFQSPTRDHILAFAGLLQSASLVTQLATRDSHDEGALLSSALSVLRVDADNVADVYGSVDELRLGLQAVSSLLGGRPGESSKPIFQYAVAMHQLALKLPAMTHVSSAVHAGLLELQNQKLSDGEIIDDDEEGVEQLYESLASLYSRTISTLTPRIMVQGSQGRLSSPETVNRVRAALFAGIRSAFLWHQIGGRRWHLLFQRRQYQNMAARLGRI